MYAHNYRKYLLRSAIVLLFFMGLASAGFAESFSEHASRVNSNYGQNRGAAADADNVEDEPTDEPGEEVDVIGEDTGTHIDCDPCEVPENVDIDGSGTPDDDGGAEMDPDMDVPDDSEVDR